MTIVKNIMEKPSFFIMDFEGSYEALYAINIFDLHSFDNETTALIEFFEISMEINASYFFIFSK